MTNTYAHRSLLYRALNALGNTVEKLSVPTNFEAERLLSKARHITQLSDFGESHFMTGFNVLLQSLEQDANLNAIGKISAKTHLLQLLINRLYLENDRKQIPKIAEQTIRRPIFITGLPRSGTTLLHALLAEDPNTRTPITWEVMYPSPPPHKTSFSQDERLKRCANNLRWLDRFAPKFNSIHAIKAHLPQECIAITTHAFASIEFHTTFNVPGYQTWLEQTDMRVAYRYHKQFLQHLQSHHKGQRWLLKAPGHMFDLAALMQVYPDAQIIQTHRDPLKVVASISSHANVIRAAFSDDLDPKTIANDWQQYWQRALSRTLEYRQQHPQQTISDVYYADLIADPISVVKRLYQELNIEYTHEFETAMQRYTASNPQAKHHYTLQEFGFTADNIKAKFADYYQFYTGLANV